ncbi:MAG: hypothetical protein U0324_38425 [Polyangiales bacterium]
MRPLAALLLVTACDAVTSGPVERTVLFSDGPHRVVATHRTRSTFHDPVSDYAVAFSHDGGRTSRDVMRGTVEDFARRARAWRLADGRLAVCVFDEVCVDASPGPAACASLYRTDPPPPALHDALATVARERPLETVIRARAALALARAGAPAARGVCAALLAEEAPWGEHAAPLRDCAR